VTICPGTQAANSAAFRALAAPGDPVLLESPTYLGALVAAQAAGLRIVPVPTDDEGVRPDLLAEAFRRTGSRLFYCQPCHANPTGAVHRSLPPIATGMSSTFVR
jgi:DNA-binding transcriptional MocR family regulator